MRPVLVAGVTGFAGSHRVDDMFECGDCEIVGINLPKHGPRLLDVFPSLGS
jgi:nucleoside-diphosphate-sugar epimerase